MSYKVKFHHVTKRYKMYDKSLDKLKDLFLGSKSGQYHYALDDVSFEVEEGEIVGIIGLNGSGKSTLSNLIAGVTMPNEGRVEINGSAALIAISSGLNGQLTGLENIELKGLMMGLSKEQIKEITPKVIQFADIGEFINQPVKTYSSGMKARLGFAISINIDPDILVIDEALSVGDETFTDKCLEKMNEFKEQGKTIFFISHSLTQVKSFCTKALWLHFGKVGAYGEIDDVILQYRRFLKQYKTMTPQQKRRLKQNQLKEFKQSTSQEEPAGIPRRRKRSKKRNKKAAAGILSAFLLAGGGLGAYKAFDLLKEPKKETSPKTESKPILVEKQSNKSKKAQPPLFVVNGTDVVVREKPNKGSNWLSIMNFGEVYRMMQNKKDEAGDSEWMQVQLKTGETGWVSSRLLTPLDPSLVNGTLDTLSPIVNKKYGLRASEVASFLGKTLQELKESYPGQITSERNSSDGLLVNFDDVQFVVLDNVVTEVLLRNAGVSQKEMTKLLGQPVLSSKNQTLFFYQLDSYYLSASAVVPGGNIETLSITKKAQ
jgi:teichoic acid transport system ATP-binding protein